MYLGVQKLFLTLILAFRHLLKVMSWISYISLHAIKNRKCQSLRMSQIPFLGPFSVFLISVITTFVAAIYCTNYWIGIFWIEVKSMELLIKSTTYSVANCIYSISVLKIQGSKWGTFYFLGAKWKYSTRGMAWFFGSK